ncbi:MAG: VanZ family protein [Candidatus Neomarinimicrobiota bacterium]
MRKGRFFFFATLTLVYSTLLMVFILLPSDSFPSHKIFAIDKLWHSLSYFILMIALALSFKQIENSPVYYKSQAFIFTFLHACVSEFFQQYSPGRASDLADWIANVIGILLALLLINILLNYRAKRI